MPTLNINFKTEKDFNNAVEWFDCSNDESLFANDFDNYEFRSIGFIVQDEQDADSTELALTNELNQTEIDNYYFEYED